MGFSSIIAIPARLPLPKIITKYLFNKKTNNTSRNVSEPQESIVDCVIVDNFQIVAEAAAGIRVEGADVNLLEPRAGALVNH